MCLHVMCQTVSPIERRPAHHTNMLPVDVVNPHVPHQFILPPEALFAAGALEGPHARVRGHVPVQLAFPHERLGANVAGVGAVARVDGRVQAETVLTGEAFVACQAWIAFDF